MENCYYKLNYLQLDHTGHLFGPYSKEMEEKLYSVDKTLGYLIDQLKAKNLFEKMNLIVTSDHGMEEISKERAIFLDSFIDTELFDAYGSRACWSLFVKNGKLPYGNFFFL